jgi:hypothetical protein
MTAYIGKIIRIDSFNAKKNWLFKCLSFSIEKIKLKQPKIIKSLIRLGISDEEYLFLLSDIKKIKLKGKIKYRIYLISGISPAIINKQIRVEKTIVLTLLFEIFLIIGYLSNIVPYLMK